MIFASAGSGKTHALTTRYIRLLSLGVAPERIVALTFTRKAAAEFFAEIVRRLAGAAQCEVGASRLATDVGNPSLRSTDFLHMLRAMIGAMHRLSLGTLDGFFARIVRAFPLELGLNGEPAVLDEAAAAEEVRRVLAALFAPQGELAPEQRALMEAFKLATFGTEDKAVADRLDGFIGQHLALYRAAPAEISWGGVQRIWPRGFPWGEAEEDANAAARALLQWCEQAELKDKQRERWRGFATAAAAWSPGGPMPREVTYVLEKALAAWPEIEAGCVELRFDRQRQALDAAACAALRLLVRRVVALELGRRLAVTQGIGAVLRAFDALYDREVRRTGRLTFADMQQLLLPTTAAARLSMDPLHDHEDDPVERRLQIDYRLDGRFEHWMFDEFQDTSFQQWQILQSLIDEVMFEAEGRRSFFYVGDVKQAIYTWREGDPRLFTYVAQRYAHLPGGGIAPRELNESWRSGPAVVEMVNRVCGHALVMREHFPEAATEWNRHWRRHRSARPERVGQAALLVAADEEERWRATLQVLQALSPIERGLTCAVLVRTNDTGARLADYLRREGAVAAVAEADLKIAADNPVTAGLIALLRAAAHPGDTLAQRHVAMSPLGDLLTREGLARADDVCESQLATIHAEGFEHWLEGWRLRLDAVLAPEDSFSRLRLRQLVMAGQAFDASGARDVDAFLRFLDGYTAREPEGAGVVRIMTIHKSKGLGFDVVVLPDLEGDKLAQRRKGPAVRKTAERAVDWVLEYPGELVAAHDPVLRSYLEEAVAENCYEQMSLLYVALTRPKHALYAIIEPRGKSQSLNFPCLLTETLGSDEGVVRVGKAELSGYWSVGDSDWVDACERKAPKSQPEALPAIVSSTERRVRVARRPSSEKIVRIDAGRLFGSTATAAETGLAVHALLAEVEWLEAGAPSVATAFREAWGRRSDQSEAARVAWACLSSPALTHVWRRPQAAAATLWRERPFELVDGDIWLTGVFDRVIVERDETGRTVRATVYDFKTDVLEPDGDLRAAAARHGAQMRSYGRAVARLTGLALADVRLEVVFTSRLTSVTVAT